MNDSLTCSRLPLSAYDEWEPLGLAFALCNIRANAFQKTKRIGPWESPPLSQGLAVSWLYLPIQVRTWFSSLTAPARLSTPMAAL